MKKAKPVFKEKIKAFDIKSGEKWVIWGPGKAKLMNILGNKYLCDPPLSLQYGKIKGRQLRIEQVLFKGVVPTAHLSARYEYFKDDFDQNCKKFIINNAIGSNAVSYDVATSDRVVNMILYEKLVSELFLEDLQERWVMGLSNGQMRRARLAYSLLKEPDLLLIDDPFLGLDPTAASIISNFLATYDESLTSVVIGMRYQDEIPPWCTHICHVKEEEGVVFQGSIETFHKEIISIKNEVEAASRTLKSNTFTIEDLISPHPWFGKSHHEIIKMPNCVELNYVDVKYKGEPVLKNLTWKVRPGSNWHIKGNNGTGKSTLLSLLTAEHPQSWNSKIIENGAPRRSGKANYFDINKRIGMSAPELHAILLRNVGSKQTVREIISSGFHDASSNNFIPLWDNLDKNKRLLIDMLLTYFNMSTIADSIVFGQLTVSQQKLVMFIRSLVKMPEILILDEAFSGMEIEPMIRCHELLEEWPGTILAVSHVEEETPKCDYTLRLIAPGQFEINDQNNNL